MMEIQYGSGVMAPLGHLQIGSLATPWKILAENIGFYTAMETGYPSTKTKIMLSYVNMKQLKAIGGIGESGETAPRDVDQAAKQGQEVATILLLMWTDPALGKSLRLRIVITSVRQLMEIGGSGEIGERVPENVDMANKHGEEVATVLLLLMEDQPALAMVFKLKVVRREWTLFILKELTNATKALNLF